jgi:hypothetical protein
LLEVVEAMRSGNVAKSVDGMFPTPTKKLFMRKDPFWWCRGPVFEKRGAIVGKERPLNNLGAIGFY